MQDSPSLDGEVSLQPLGDRKRKRMPTTPVTDVEELADDNEDDFTIKLKGDDIELHTVVKQLRGELAQKESIINWQQMEMERLQNMIRSLPQQAVYDITGMMGQGGAGGQMV